MLGPEDLLWGLAIPGIRAEHRCKGESEDEKVGGSPGMARYLACVQPIQRQSSVPLGAAPVPRFERQSSHGFDIPCWDRRQHQQTACTKDRFSLRRSSATRARRIVAASYKAEDWLRVQRLYAANAFSPMWFDTTGDVRRLQPRAAVLIEALSNASDQALPLEKYPYDALLDALAKLKNGGAASTASAAAADVALTATFVAFGTDLLIGQINPHTVNRGWHIDPTNVDVDSVLKNAMNQEQFSEAIATLEPQDSDYVMLKRHLARYRQVVAAGGWPTLQSRGSLKPGDSTASNFLDQLLTRLQIVSDRVKFPRE